MTVIDQPALQRRTVRTLALTNAIGGIGVTTGVTVATLLAVEVSGGEELAGFSQTAQVTGAAVMAFALARVMATRGRRPGLVLGYAVGAAGALLCVLAGTVKSFPLLLLAAFLFGAGTASNSQSRFAATDLASEEHRGRDLSMVVWATTIGAVIGPNLADVGGTLARALGLPPLTGAFLITATALLVTLVLIWTLLRPDPLLVAHEAALRERPDAPAAPSAWSLVRSHRLIALCVAAIACAHTVMVSVMIMTPIHMRHGDASVRIIGLTISGHILGMYVFSPLVGKLVDRIGAWRVMLVGALVEAVSLVMSATSDAGSSWWLSVALFLLGLGWSFAMIGSSSALVKATPVLGRAPVQGFADLAQGICAAIGGALGGVIVSEWGYPTLALLCLPAAAVVAVVALGMRRHASPA